MGVRSDARRFRDIDIPDKSGRNSGTRGLSYPCSSLEHRSRGQLECRSEGLGRWTI
jgi:hypothetical protein